MDKRHFLQSAAVAAYVLGAAVALAESSEAKRKPNFVVIFIDDMGYGEIGPFGSKINNTPRLDRMASEGLKLTSFYAAPVCSPSRAALMTGCYPKRVGLAKGSWAGVLFPKDPHGLNPKEKTVAEVLKDAGYATGCFGKWHLGDQPEFLPTNHGFDTYFGIPYSNDMWPLMPAAKKWKSGACLLPVLRGTKVVDIVKDMDDQAQLCRRFTDEAIGFIRKNKDRPFFVYLPHAFIHGPRKARTEFMDKAGGNATRAQIEELDWSTGLLLDTIRELGLAENTLVLFTSDNGGLGDSNKPLRGGKGSTWEGGMREPTIAWWPGTIPANSASDEIASTMDILPTLAAVAGAKAPDDRAIDGKDITPLLRDPERAKSPHKAFFYYGQDTLQAVRSGPWKLHVKGQLYNLDKDIGEQKDVAGENPEIVARLRKHLDECRADLDDPKNCRPVGLNEDPQYLVPLSDATPAAESTAAQPAGTAAPTDAIVWDSGVRTPVLVGTKRGTTLLVATKRRGDDFGPHDVILRRSTDDGETWGQTIDVTSAGGQEGIRCANPSVVADRQTGIIWLFFNRGEFRGARTRPICFTYSEDDGLTWAKPKKLGESERFSPEMEPLRTGTGHGIQLSTGRLLVNCCTLPGFRPVCLYSDDHGKTWQRGEPLPEGPKHVEYCLLELADGTVYMNIRAPDGQRQGPGRYVSLSKDGGITWTVSEPEHQLAVERKLMNAVRVSDERHDDKNRVLFAGPVGPGDQQNLWVFISYDECRSWARCRLLRQGPAVYSDMIVFPDKTIGCAYETKGQSIRFARFTLEWLTEGKEL